MAINNMQSIVQMRKNRVALERQALSIFRVLLKAERKRKAPGLSRLSAKTRDDQSRRVKVLETQISQIRREIRKIRSMS